ncbi:MAG: 4-alpha-glucanotransferase [Lachnospiraceae bacterium]
MRKSGVLMHLSSLPSPYGVGTMGQAARDFVDFLKKAGQSYWQILPICPTSYGDSPYQSFSTFAGNPYFIDLDELEKEGLLKKSEYENIDWESTPDRVNYGALYHKRYGILAIAAKRFLLNPSKQFDEFCRKNEYWLDDYALFMILKNVNGGVSWLEWDLPLRNHEEKALKAVCEQYDSEIMFWKVMQYFFFSQWNVLRIYANERGIDIIGDLPFYVALDSVDVWAHPEMFQLDENRKPVEVAGCPPDGFSATGQLWGNPLFDWDELKENDYGWWVQRIGYLCKVYNVLRIDHFRGFDSYYAIPYGSTDASGGSWHTGPGIRLFEAMEKAIGPQRIIAEDLGFLTESVRTLLRESGFPGMKVLEFAFDRRDSNNSDYLPYNYTKHCVAYTGTHDNDTVQGWFTSADPEDVAYAIDYLRLNDAENYHWDMMCALWSSVADLAIVQAQDILGLGSDSRMNTPSTLGNNWVWRVLPGSLNDTLAEKLRYYTELYGRL